MKFRFLLVLVAVCLPTAANAQTRVNPRKTQVSKQIAQTTNEQVLPICRVILYSNGVAYIERRGTISGRAEINLSFTQSQIDDVLKSMVVLDLGQGRIGAVSYNSSAPPSARMAEIPFKVEAETGTETTGGLAQILSQLQGTRVSVVSPKQTAMGAILTVEKRQTVKESTKKSKDGEELESEKTATPINYSLVVAGENGEIASFDLAEIRSVKLLDDATRKDVNEFAAVSASARRKDAKTITVTSEGANTRELVVSYTIAAPIWKTTYRVVLDKDGKPFFQGWAIVDNVSDEDWREVNLSLVSGSPISFIQPLQSPLFRHRPIVEIPEDLSLEPQIYEPGVQVERGVGFGGGSGSGYGSGSGGGIGIAPPEPDMKTELSDVLASENSGVETAAKGERLGDLFEYTVVQPVSVPRNRSALIPIVQTKMDGERISVYNQQVREDRPMSGLLLKNTTDLTFENGALTVFERNAYAGESLMERLKPAEERLVSFALDLETLVQVKQEENREPAKLVKAANGAFQIHYFKTDRKIYTLQNQTERARTIYLEHPVRENWRLSNDTASPAETTQSYYRFRIALKPFEKVVFPVTERQALMDSYQLTKLSRDNLDLFIRQRSINDEVRQKLEKLIDLRARVGEIEEKLKTLEAEANEIGEDQSRLRENIETLAKTPEAKQLINRYITKANEQETRIEQITKERQTLTAERERLERELAAAIRAFEI
ncbi:MAG: hypothetical protein M3209_15285 [Acidobacteriota bacterium]|nr:hypothetical protein [Acidobacteriota bacterium]